MDTEGKNIYLQSFTSRYSYYVDSMLEYNCCVTATKLVLVLKRGKKLLLDILKKDGSTLNKVKNLEKGH